MFDEKRKNYFWPKRLLYEVLTTDGTKGEGCSCGTFTSKSGEQQGKIIWDIAKEITSDLHAYVYKISSQP